MAPDHRCLFEQSSTQYGYFTSAQGRVCGFSWDRLADNARRGRFIRIRRGLYRLRDYPSFPREEIVAAWLAMGGGEGEDVVVSHESALEVHDLSDVIPDAVHLTVPRSRRYQSRLPGVMVHTTTKPWREEDIAIQDGIRLTSVKRTILDAAEAGTGPEQIEMAIQQAVRRGLVTRAELTRSAREQSQRVASLVQTALQDLSE